MKPTFEGKLQDVCGVGIYLSFQNGILNCQKAKTMDNSFCAGKRSFSAKLEANVKVLYFIGSVFT